MYVVVIRIQGKRTMAIFLRGFEVTRRGCDLVVVYVRPANTRVGFTELRSQNYGVFKMPTCGGASLCGVRFAQLRATLKVNEVSVFWNSCNLAWNRQLQRVRNSVCGRANDGGEGIVLSFETLSP